MGWLLVLWLAHTAAASQTVVEVPITGDRQSLNPALEYLVDDSARWRPDSGVAPPGHWRLLRQRPGKDHFDFIDHPVWFRVVLRSPVDGEWVWMLDMNQLDDVAWLVQREGQAPRWSEAGLGPMQAGTVPPQRQPTLNLRLSAGESVTVYMRVRTIGILRLAVGLQDATAWRAEEGRRQIGLGAYFGLLIGLLAYNGFLALRLRDPAYGYYIGFGLSLGLFQLCSTGFGPSLFWTGHALLTYPVLMLAAQGTLASALMFTDTFLRVRRFSPNLSRVLRSLALIWLLLLMLTLALMQSPDLPLEQLMRLALPLGLCTIPLILVSGVWAWFKRVWAAGFFLLAWSGVVAAMFARALIAMGIAPIESLAYDSLLITSAAEMVLLSLALADRMATERRARAESDLQRVREQAAREKAQHALEEKSRFLAAITHDLQQPLYALSLATESLARRDTEGLSPQALTQMRSALFSADELMASLAMNVRLDRDNLLPEFEVFSVQDMLERVDTLFTTRAQQVGLRWRVLPSLALVHSDPLMLERMVCNLVSNAMRYTQQGGVLLSCRTRADHLLIQVWDTGPGIAAHEQAAIFEAYQRGSAAQSHDQGLGLGLSIVNRCAHLLGIRVDLRSVPGRGSCFALRVPLAPAAPMA